MAMHNPPHPGEALREDVLPAINMTVSGLARHIGYSRGQLSTVLNGRAAISADRVSLSWGSIVLCAAARTSGVRCNAQT